MADLMDLYGGMGPGVGGMWAGQNQDSKMQDAAQQRALQQSHIQDILGRLGMAQEKQPFDIAQMQAGTAQTQQQTRGLQNTNDINDQVGIQIPAEAKAEELKSKIGDTQHKRLLEYMGDVASGHDP